jgi:DNA-binding MarR family transcriptional regulator
MEREGLVVRIPKKPGHPYTEVKLTPKGKKACAPAIAILKDVIAETMSVMSEEELEQLGKLTRPLQLKALEMLNMNLKQSPGNPEAVTMPVKVHKRNQNK